MRSDRRQLCSFYLGGHLCGIPVEQVQEVLRPSLVTPVLLAPSLILGLINLRGQIVTAFDLRRCLDFSGPKPDDSPVNLVLSTSLGIVSVEVDEIRDVIELSDDQYERSPETLPGLPREIVRGAYKLDPKLLLVLDVESALRGSSIDHPLSARTPHTTETKDAP